MFLLFLEKRKRLNSLGSDEVQRLVLWLLLLLLMTLLGVGEKNRQLNRSGNVQNPGERQSWPEKVAVLLDQTDSGRERRHREMNAGTRSY